jgi:hypothetical protein
MAFKSAASDMSVHESPDKLFRELTRRKFPDVLHHQAEMVQAYAALSNDVPDVALQLPTGPLCCETGSYGPLSTGLMLQSDSVAGRYTKGIRRISPR